MAHNFLYSSFAYNFFTDDATNPTNLSFIEIDRNSIYNQSTATGFIVEPVYYDYETDKLTDIEDDDGGGAVGGGSSAFASVLKPPKLSESLQTKITPTAEPETLPTTSLNYKRSDIYPNPEKIYLSLAEIKKNKFLKMDAKREEEKLLNPDESVDDGFDKDLKGHDLIDNIMYIYYGGNSVIRKGLGGNIIVIGAVCGLAAQILTIALSFLRNRRLRRTNNALFPIAINLLTMMCISNFVFIIGVQSYKNILKCEIIAILLHLLHLSTSAWGFIYILAIYQFLKYDKILNLRKCYMAAYGGTSVFILVSYVFANDGYEIQNYCWMSVQRGMIFSYMVPVSILIISSTFLGTSCLRTITSMQRQAFGDTFESIIESAKLSHQPVKLDKNVCHKPHVKVTHRTKIQSVIKAHLQTSTLIEQTNFQQCAKDFSTGSVGGFENTGSENDNNDNELDENYLLRSRIDDFYDSKFNLAALSIADLDSLHSSSDLNDFMDFKKAINFSLFFVLSFNICWFLSVVALENKNSSCAMPIVYVIAYNLMSWYILIKISVIYPMINITTSSLFCDERSHSVCSSTSSSPTASIKFKQEKAIEKLFNKKSSSSSTTSLNHNHHTNTHHHYQNNMVNGRSINFLSHQNSPTKKFLQFNELQNKSTDQIPLLCTRTTAKLSLGHNINNNTNHNNNNLNKMSSKSSDHITSSSKANQSLNKSSCNNPNNGSLQFETIINLENMKQKITSSSTNFDVISTISN